MSQTSKKRFCACGCGTDITRYKKEKVVRGHLKNLAPKFCLCGCGGSLEQKSLSSGYIAKYIHGHNDAYEGKSQEERRRILEPNIRKSVEARQKLRQDPEWVKFDAEQKAKGQTKRWSEATAEEKKAHGQRSADGQSDEGKETWRNGYTQVTKEGRCIQAEGCRKFHSNLSDTEKKARAEVLSEAAKRDHRENPDRYVNCGPRTWYHELPSGRLILVQSSWEANTAEVLERTGTAFTRGPQVNLKTCTWRPDFEVGDLYIEVKGHPLAIEQFENMQRPEIHILDKAVVMVYFNPTISDFDSFAAFLDAAEFVHVPETLSPKYEQQAA